MANTLRVSDNASEKAVSEFLDRHFYPKNVTNLIRFNDFETQMKGVDVQFDYKNFTNMLVDEKAAAHYVNKNLPTFAFEVNFLTSSGNLAEGWLFDTKKVTQFYLLSWISATKEKYFNVNDITQLDVLLIERSKIINMLASFGLTKDIATTKANNIRKNNITGGSEKNSINPFNFHYTDFLSEKPINIIIRKHKLGKSTQIDPLIPA
jgi:hypothetical protein